MKKRPNTQPNVTALELSQADRQRLDQLERKFQLVRDYTTSVVMGFTTGFYLFGPGGSGKTYTVVGELKRRQVPFKLFNSRMTGRGLYNSLEKFPDAIHLLEDMEQLFYDSGARGVLRSALWGQPSDNQQGAPERLITWTTFKMEHSFVFTGGLIMTANKPFPELPEIQALKTRIAYMQLTADDNQMAALMRKVSLDGHRRGSDFMDGPECIEICEFVINECLGLNRLLDMRLLINSFSDYLQWRDCESGVHWKDLASTRVKERPTRISEVHSISDRTKQKQRELDIATRIIASTENREERFRLWREQTNKSEQTLYRRIAELKEADSSNYH